MQFKIKPHDVDLGRAMVEIYDSVGQLIGCVYAEPGEIRIVSKFISSVQHDQSYPPTVRAFLIGTRDSE